MALNNPRSAEANLGDRMVRFETGRMAKQADGSVLVQQGETVVLVAVTAAKEGREGIDFFPLTVEYRERAYASGRVPGGFFKREGRPADHEILGCRLTDRPIRPLFPEGYTNEVQIFAYVLSADGEHDADVLAVTGASAALALSSIPVGKLPIGCVRIVKAASGEWIVNPKYTERDGSTVDLVVAASREAILMVEGGAREASEEDVLEAFRLAQQACQKLIDAQTALAKGFAKEKTTFAPPASRAEITKAVEDAAAKRMSEAVRHPEKQTRTEQVKALTTDVAASLAARFPESDKAIRGALKDLEIECIRKGILDRSERPDGRKPDEIRAIECEVAVLPRTHGSSLFTRGQTQSLATVTLGTSDDTQLIEDLRTKWEKSYLLHYNFPPFSVGEVRPIRGTSRREIGHGILAERALKPVLPAYDEFPYTIRVVSDILESNGSSSMASVCAGSLALMDAGVPIKKPVAGIAMGVVIDEDDPTRFRVLTDIQGAEDHFGDMDFKIAGTADGITSIQMDIKVWGVPHELLRQALTQAKAARLHILAEMQKAIAAPRSALKPHAPQVETIRIPPDKIKEVIGPGGKVIRRLCEQWHAKIDVEDDGRILVYASNTEDMTGLKEEIKAITASAEIGRIYQGTVRKIAEFGAFVELFPGTDGLVHISQIMEGRLRRVDDVLREGDEVAVKVIEVDRQTGKIRLSRKEAVAEQGPDPVQARVEEYKKKVADGLIDDSAPPRSERHDGDRGSRGGGDRERRGGFRR